MAERITNQITQALVLPRGIESAQSPFAGTAQWDSPASGDTYDRAIAIARYSKQNPDLKRVAFVSLCSFMMPKYARPDTSEAVALATVARENGLGQDVIIALGEESQSSVGGIVEAIEKELIDPELPVLLVAHDNHIERILEYCRLAMPNTDFPYLSADNPDRTTHNPTVSRNDKIARKMYEYALRDVEPGDIDAMDRADHKVQRLFAPIVALRGIGRVRVANLQTQTAS
jgi:hypothetical protein